MAANKIARKTTAMIVAEDLRQRIIEGQLKGGEQIRQDAVANELGVSRIPVREALKQLEAEGLIKLVSHKGAVVIQLSKEEIAELFDLRVVLETWLLEQAISKMTEADFSRLQQILDKMIHEEDVIENWGELNRAWHDALLMPSGCQKTMEILDRILANIDRFVRLQISLTHGQKKAHAEHGEILQLCREGEIEKAKAALTGHITDVRDGLMVELARQMENETI